MQVYFLFLESLGTPEMILIALVALIIFGPRKLPTIGRTIGKYTAEFKRASREFRETFEREVQMAELEEKQIIAPVLKDNEITDSFNAVENTVGRSSARAVTIENEDSLAAIEERKTVAIPDIRPVSQSDFVAQSTNSNSVETSEVAENAAPRRKREWL